MKQKESACKRELRGALSQALQLAQLQALDRVMAMAAFEVDGTLCRANANYLKLMGLSRHRLGGAHSSFCSARRWAATSTEIWSHLCAGMPIRAWWSAAAMAAVAGWKPPIHR
jgi:hypothetical protein